MNLIHSTDDTIRITPYGLEIRRLLSFDDWKTILRQTREVKNVYHSILADITAYGRKTFGDDIVNEALEQLQFDFSDAIRAESISLIPLDERKNFDLSSEHSYVLGTMLDDSAERTRWAAICLHNGLTAAELKKSIIAGEVRREEDSRERSGHTGGVASLEAIRFHFLRWQRQVKDPDSILQLPPDARRKALENLTPIVDLAAKIEASLQVTTTKTTKTKTTKKTAK